MTDIAAPTAPPPLVTTLAHDFAQKALTTLSATLATAGVLTGDQQTQFVSLGVSLALFAVSCAWTFVAAKVRTSCLAAAIAAPAVTPPTQGA